MLLMYRNISVLFVLLLVSVFSQPIFATSITENEAIDLIVAKLSNGHYGTARDNFKALAEQGNSRAQILLGIMYSEGRGIKRNVPEARVWYQRAAVQGDTQAQFLLGLSYINRYAKFRDHEMAYIWISRAAESNNLMAQKFMLQTFEQGWLNMPADKQKVKYWRERLASSQ